MSLLALSPRYLLKQLAAPGSKTVIPCSVKGKFSIRLVPNLTVKATADAVVKYVQEEFKKLGSKNTCEVAMTHGGEPWLADPNVGLLQPVAMRLINKALLVSCGAQGD